MALTGITRTDTFDYVSNDDPCKRQVQKVVASPQPINPADPQLPAVIVEGEFDTVIDDGASIFKLGVLDVFLMGMIYDRATSLKRSIDVDGEVSVTTAINATNIDTVRYGLKAWEHFRSAVDGSDIEFKTEERIVMGRKYTAATDAMLNLLGVRLIGELAQQIKEASEVSAGEAKNSAAA